MLSENSKYWNLISRYLADSLNKEEEKELFRWMNESPANRNVFEEIKSTWENTLSGSITHDFDTNKDWLELKQKILLDSNRENHKIISISRKKFILLAGAAVIIILFGINIVLNSDSKGIKNEVAWLELKTPADSTISFYLPDSSQIILNENSTFLYPTSFEEKERKVSLIGEAYLNITPNPSRPFIIYTDRAQIKVLGTSFKVQSYEEDENVEVEVYEGKVELSSNEDKDHRVSIIIETDEKGVLQKSTHDLSKNKHKNKVPKWLNETEEESEELINKIKKEFKSLK